MPWYLRKSFGRGPFRLNLSKRGLGASVGVKGLRVGLGPRGPYVAGGRGGLYFRQSLALPGSRPRAASRPSPISPRFLPTYSQQPENATLTEQVTAPIADDVVAAEIKARLQAPRYAAWLIAAAILVLLIAATKGYGLAGIPVALGIFGLAAYVNQRERERRTIVFSYDESEDLVIKFAAFRSALHDAATCKRIWRVTTAAATRDRKHNAGAGNLITRQPTQFGFGSSLIRSNISLAWVGIGGGNLYFLPERMLYIDATTVVSLDYGSIEFSARGSQYIETDSVPGDAKLVSTTWQYVNKNGGPDRRFANNRQLPVLAYSELKLEHPHLRADLQFSRADVAAHVEQSFATFRMSTMAARR